MTDFRALCAELLDEFYYTDWSDAEELKARARAALAEPADAPAAGAEGLSDEELRDLWSWAAGQDQGPWPTQQHAFAARVAELLGRNVAPVPVPVAERPWEREGWCDMDGECWWCPPDGPAYWSMVNPAMVYGGWLLPHWAIHQPPSVPALPVPAPQGGEVEP